MSDSSSETQSRDDASSSVEERDSDASSSSSGISDDGAQIEKVSDAVYESSGESDVGSSSDDDEDGEMLPIQEDVVASTNRVLRTMLRLRERSERDTQDVKTLISFIDPLVKYVEFRNLEKTDDGRWPLSAAVDDRRYTAAMFLLDRVWYGEDLAEIRDKLMLQTDDEKAFPGYSREEMKYAKRLRAELLISVKKAIVTQ